MYTSLIILRRLPRTPTQALRDDHVCGGEGADGSTFVLNAELEPKDSTLAAAPGAEERTAHHKALGAKAFGAKVRLTLSVVHAPAAQPWSLPS